jgi:DNA invertase Pin-like site-specific DNA recombinase
VKAALYLRISSDPTGQEAGVTRQEEDCRELAAALGWEVAEVYRDNDISASTGKRRPAYEQMLADITAGKVGAIICWHPDRLYRRAVDLAPLIDVCKAANAQISTVNAGTVDLTTPTGRLVAGLLAQVATYEGEHKAERWTRSYRQRREAGAPPGSGPRMFGWTRSGELIEDEAETTRWMAREIIAGSTVTSVCRALEARGVLTTAGNPWQPSALRKYLRNARLAGHSVLKGDIVGVGLWQPILDSDTWEMVRALLGNRSRPRPPRVALLAGILYCGTCGERMVTAARGQGKRIYRCPKRPGFNGCGGVSGDAPPIEEVVESYARERLADDRVRASVTRIRSTAGASELLAEIGALEQRVIELEAELDAPGKPVAMILRAVDRAKERLGECQVALANLAPTDVPARGGDWPEDLDRRRRLVSVALEGRRVFLDPGTGGKFKPDRVRIEPLPDAL